MVLCHFLKIWFTPLINQPFKILLGASNFLKTHGHASAISSLLEIFSASLPPKNCNFWLNILPLDFLIFQVVLLFNLIHYSCDSISLYLIVFLETMQELMKILLVS